MTAVPGRISRIYVSAGAPTNGTNGTFAKVAPKGALVVDSTNAGVYQNTGTFSSPTWTALGDVAPVELTNLLAAIPTATVADVASPDSAAAGGSAPVKAEYDVVVAEANETKQQLNALLAKLRTAGIVTA